VWSWDITYLKSPTRGVFFYLYLVVDVWSRKIVGAEVYEEESSELASTLVEQTIASEQADPTQLVLHSDNGGPMKGATLKATLEALGVMASYSRPRVSDDNPFSEALFRTLKYRPNYPRKPFQSLADARRWVAEFVTWYNSEHLHSGIGFVTPSERHNGTDKKTLARRRAVYVAARKRHPERWARHTRNWSASTTVILNPSKQRTLPSTEVAHAA
jgi:transposase InsO family protein